MTNRLFHQLWSGEYVYMQTPKSKLELSNTVLNAMYDMSCILDTVTVAHNYDIVHGI